MSSSGTIAIRQEAAARGPSIKELAGDVTVLLSLDVAVLVCALTSLPPIVHRYHGRKRRYLGARKSTLQAVWTTVLVNVHPIAAALRTQAA